MYKLFIILAVVLAFGAFYILFLKPNPGLNIPEVKDFSCEKLYDKILTEANEIDRSCENDNDCLAIGGHACGDCINKDADTTEYFKDIEKQRAEKCKVPAYSCALSIGCRCVNSKCESII